jgi:uncharacterized protein (DUF305 family)
MMIRRNIKARAVVKAAQKPIEEVKEEIAEMPTYSKTEINRMSTADLKELAKEQGIDNELSGADIKKALIKKFGL